MAKAGVAIDVVVDVVAPGPIEADQLLQSSASALEGYRSVSTRPGSVQLTRVYRPTWAVVTAWVTALPTVGLGLLFLLVRNTEVCTIVTEDLRGKFRARVHGILVPSAWEDLRERLLNGRVPRASANPPAAVVVEHGPATPEPIKPQPVSPDPRQRWSDGALPRATAAGSLPGSAASRAAADAARAPGDPPAVDGATIRRDGPRRDPIGVPPGRLYRPRLRFDDGQLVVVTGFGLVGRDPAPGPGDPHCLLVTVPDEGLSVSKTHFAFGLESGHLWIVDRASTNGTSVTDPKGQRTVLTPGVRVGLEEGSIIGFGDHRAVVDTVPVVAAPDPTVIVPAASLGGTDGELSPWSPGSRS